MKNKIIRTKIEENKVNPNEMNHNILYQKIYFECLHGLHPTLSYYDIALKMKETYHVNSIKYSIVQFNNYKQSLKKDFFYELRKNLLDNIELDNEKLLKLKLEFLNDDNNENKNTIRILGTAQSLKL